MPCQSWRATEEEITLGTKARGNLKLGGRMTDYKFAEVI